MSLLRASSNNESNLHLYSTNQGNQGSAVRNLGLRRRDQLSQQTEKLLILNVKLHIPSPRGAQKGQGVSDCMGKLSGLEWSNLLEYNFKSELPGLSLNTSNDMTF